MPPFVLVDGSYFLFRAYHALPPLTTSTGLHTNAIRGAISAIQKLMRRMQPTHMAVIFDTPEPTFRHKLSPIYKGDRPTMPEELSQQIPYLHALIKAQGIPLYSLPVQKQMILSVRSLNVPYSKAIMYLSQPEIKTWLSSSMIM